MGSHTCAEIMPVPNAVVQLLKHLDLIKWECMSVTAVVWAAAIRRDASSIPDPLVIAIVTACMWLIAGEKADVHTVVTVAKTFVTCEHDITSGLARIAGQIGGGILGSLIVIILDNNSKLDLLNYSYGNTDFTQFINEGIAASIILLVLHRIEKTEADEVAAFGFAAVLYAMGQWSNNPARVIGPQLLQSGGPEDDFALVWFGPLLGAPGYGVLQFCLTGEVPAVFTMWPFNKLPCCKPCQSANDDEAKDAVVEEA